MDSQRLVPPSDLFSRRPGRGAEARLRRALVLRHAAAARLDRGRRVLRPGGRPLPAVLRRDRREGGEAGARLLGSTSCIHVMALASCL